MNRKTAREEAFKQIFQRTMNDEPIKKSDLTEDTLFIINGVKDKEEEISELIKHHLENWSYERMPLVERTILQIATFELKFTEDVPVAVGINEALNLAHKYGDEKSAKFINGVLSKIIE